MNLHAPIVLISANGRMKYVSSLPPVNGLPSGAEAGKRLCELKFRDLMHRTPLNLALFIDSNLAFVSTESDVIRILLTVTAQRAVNQSIGRSM